MGERVYRICLLAYPREFRESHGAELIEVFRNCYSACVEANRRRGFAAFWLGTIWDALSNGILMRWDHAGTPPRWGTGWQNDIAYALRQLRVSPIFCLTVMLTLALGIGANSAMFSLVYGVLLAPLPFSNPARSVVLSEHAPGVDSDLVSPITYTDWTERSRSFEELAGFRYWENRSVELTADTSVPVLHVTATPNFFRALGWSPAIGRVYAEEDPAGVSEAVLGHALWTRAFHGDPDVIGKIVRISGTAFTVVGVMPPIHSDPALGLADIWTPLHRYNILQRRIDSYRARYLGVIGRLKPGISLERAREDMSTLQSQLAKEPTSVAKGYSVRLEGLTEVAARRIRPVLLALFIAVFFVLVIACANVANLMLTRAAGRAREYAVRVALGARRFHLARQLLAETLLLASLGGVAGMFLARWTIDVLKSTLADRMPRLSTVALNWPVFAFAGGLVFLIALMFSVAPLIGFGGHGLGETLKTGGRDGGGPGRSKVRGVLIAAEVAFAVLLLCCAGLILRSFGKLTAIDPGFATSHRLVADIVLPQQGYAIEAKRVQYFRDLFRRLGEHPDFRAAGAALYFPCRPKIWFQTVWVEGATVEPGLEPIVTYNLFAGDYFKAMGIPLKKGRLPREEEMWTNREVVLVNESMARQLFSGDAVGKRFAGGKNGKWSTVIGVVGDVRQSGPDQAPRPEYYVPFSSMPMPFLSVVVTTRSSPESAVAALRTVARQGAPGLQIENAIPLSDLVNNTLTLRRLALVLMALFALLSLALSGVGTYGVVSYSVAQRTREVGLRIALGATAGQVLRMIASQALRTASCGIATGLLLVALAGPAIRFLLYDVPPLDPGVLVAAPVLMLAVTAVACLLPARRAANTDPLVSLRGQ